MNVVFLIKTTEKNKLPPTNLSKKPLFETKKLIPSRQILLQLRAKKSENSSKLLKNGAVS